MRFLTGTVLRVQRSGIGYLDCGCYFVKRAARQAVNNSRPRGGGKLSLRHRSHSANRNSPFRLRGRPNQPACDRPVELGASRDARPVRRRLVGVILLISSAAFVSQSNHSRVIPTFYPMAFLIGGDADMPWVILIHPRPSYFKAGEAFVIHDRVIPSRG